MTARKFLFWCHLSAGVVAGTVILIMSVTGALLTYERQIIAWADMRGYSVGPPAPGSARLSMESLVANVHATQAGAPSAIVTVRANPGAPMSVATGQRTTYLNPYTGDVLGEGSPAVRRFFRAVTNWHRALSLQDDRRAFGRAITGACNLAFLFIVSSGLFLWWPRTWTRRHLRTVTLFNGSLRGKARDFNWHNVFGFWLAVPLFIVVLGSVVISYPWASNMVYRIVGEAPPTPQRPAGLPQAPPAGGSGSRVAGAGTGSESARSSGNPSAGERRGRSGAAPAPLAPGVGIDTLWARAERQVPSWRSISFRVPAAADAPMVFTIDEGTGGQPQKRATLALSQATGEVLRWEPYSSLSRGRRLRSWLRFAHTGEVYGLAGQTIAGVASMGGAMLVFTGLALALRRFSAWCVRARAAGRARMPAAPVRRAQPADDRV